jgi:hypothetical protein
MYIMSNYDESVGQIALWYVLFTHTHTQIIQTTKVSRGEFRLILKANFLTDHGTEIFYDERSKTSNVLYSLMLNLITLFILVSCNF